MSKSKIDYSDWSWGVVDGCTHSGHPGCDNCWAHSMANRFWGKRKFSDVYIHPERLNEVVKLKPQVIFVAPMGDLFHKDVPDEFISRVFTIMLEIKKHNYILLTKRPERMRDFMKINGRFIQNHIWLGVSVSTQNDVDEFLPILCDTPAGKRIVSAEPLLENIDMSYYLLGSQPIDWVITGSESGKNKRHADIEWFRNLRNQCVRARVPFYLKQIEIDNKIVHKPFLDGQQWLERL